MPMFGRILLFEIRYQRRRPIFLAVLILFALLGIFYATFLGLDLRRTGPVDGASSLWAIFRYSSVFGMFVSLVFVADAALRDTESQMDELVRATPTPVISCMVARFAGSLL